MYCDQAPLTQSASETVKSAVNYGELSKGRRSFSVFTPAAVIWRDFWLVIRPRSNSQIFAICENKDHRWRA